MPKRKSTPDTTNKNNSRFPAFDRVAVLLLADDYWCLIKPNEREQEHFIEKAMLEYRRKGYLTPTIFVTIATWKSPRPKKHYPTNPISRVRASTAAAFVAGSDGEAIAALAFPPMKLAGVKLRTATALLHWMRPDRFPILDIRVIKALGETIPRNWESVDYYTRIADKCRAIAANLNVDLRTLDRAMWAWDKKRNLKEQAC